MPSKDDGCPDPVESAHQAEVAQLHELINELRDPDPCRHDHHGYCQTHWWTYTDIACPHARAAALFPPDTEDKG